MKRKLTEHQIAEIVALDAEGVSQTEIARRQCVSQPVINRILRGLAYSDVTGIPPQKINRHLTQEEVEELVRPAFDAGESLKDLAVRLSSELGIRVTRSRLEAIRSSRNWSC
jgi:transposase